MSNTSVGTHLADCTDDRCSELSESVTNHAVHRSSFQIVTDLVINVQDKAKKRFAYPKVFQPTHLALGADPGKEDIPKSTTPVLLQNSISATDLQSFIKCKLQLRKKGAGMATGGEPDGAASAEFKSFAVHHKPSAKYRSKQREVEQACKFIATFGGTRDDWTDSKTDLAIDWGDALVNWFQRISGTGNSGPRSASRHDSWRLRVQFIRERLKDQLVMTARIEDAGTRTTTVRIHATTDHGSCWIALGAILGGTGMYVEP
ncbi:hypothetical protein BJ742DRAFT_868697 [Cladochytrium replicatum]|nr:hypothetical protein BJ742DRAFT_868697 [Cladochytrium replicatum]